MPCQDYAHPPPSAYHPSIYACKPVNQKAKKPHPAKPAFFFFAAGPTLPYSHTKFYMTDRIAVCRFAFG